MANPLTGEVSLVAGEQTYTLRMSINAVVELETLLDMGVMQISAILSDQQNIRLGAWRAALWAALQDHHKGTTLAMAGDIIQVATLPVVMNAVGEAMQAAFPTAANGAKSKNPQ